METLIYFLLWGALIFLMMRFGCGAHIMGHGHGQHSAHGKDNSRDQDRLRWGPPEKEDDAGGGMTVGTGKAKSAVHDGTVYYFCSSNCQDRFEAAPQLYVGAKAARDANKMEHSLGWVF